MADHILAESGTRLMTESGDLLVLALDIIGEPLPAVFISPARQLLFTAPSRGLIFVSPPRGG